MVKPDNVVSEQASQRSVRSPSRKEMRCVCRWSQHAVQGKVWCPAPHRVVETGEIFLLEFMRFWTNLLWCPGGPSRDMIIRWPQLNSKWRIIVDQGVGFSFDLGILYKWNTWCVGIVRGVKYDEMRTTQLKIPWKKVSYIPLCIALEVVLFLEVVDNVVSFNTENFWENKPELLVEWKVANVKNYPT